MTYCVQTPSQARGMALAIAGVVGLAWGAVLAASSDVGPLATAFWRMALTLPVCALLLLWHRSGQRLGTLLRESAQKHVWIAAPAFAATLMLWYAGQRLSSVATTSAMVNLSPVLVMLFVWLRYDRRPTARLLSGLGLAIGGAVVLALHSHALSDRALSGDLLALTGAATLAVYYVCITRLCRQVSAWEAMFLISLVATPLLWVAALTEAGPVAPSDGSGWMSLIALALIGQVGGQAALAAASRTLGALGTSAAALGEPAVAAMLAVLFLAAPVHALQAVGIAAVALGIWMAQARAPGRELAVT